MNNYFKIYLNFQGSVITLEKTFLNHYFCCGGIKI